MKDAQPWRSAEIDTNVPISRKDHGAIRCDGRVSGLRTRGGRSRVGRDGATIFHDNDAWRRLYSLIESALNRLLYEATPVVNSDGDRDFVRRFQL